MILPPPRTLPPLLIPPASPRRSRPRRSPAASPRRSRRRLSESDDTSTASGAATVADTPRLSPGTATATAAATPLPPPVPLPPAVTSSLVVTAVAFTASTGGWSSLPPEILHLISLFFTNIWDYLRFRAVCSSWRSNCTARTPQIPCLLLPYDPDTTARSFLDPSDFRINTINISEAQGKWIYGTPHGWLVMINKNNEHKMRFGYTLDVALLNPITRDHISLPPLLRQCCNMPEMFRGITRARPTKPLLTANPSTSSHGDFLALLILYELVFCRLGGDVWTVVDLHVNKGIHVVDFTYFNGAFYVVNATRGITVVNATTLEKKYTAPPTPGYTKTDFHLVESSGDLLLIERNRGVLVPVIEVFKLDNSGMILKWVRIEDTIGDRALFMSYNRSSISLPSGDYIRGQGDLICSAGCGYRYDDSDDMVANIRISDVVAGSSTGEKKYWQISERAGIVFDSLLGLTWIIPSLR